MLLLDVGNTRIKWAEVAQGVIFNTGAVTHGGKPADALSILGVDEPGQIWISSVAGPAHDLALSKICLARWQVSAQYARTKPEQLGLRNGYADAQRLGADRWLAMIAAWADAHADCIVVDAGTALTVDAIGADGQHRGGIIAAGLQTSEKAVIGATRFPTRETPLTVHAGLGLDTEACVRQGAMLSALGAIDRASAQLPGARRVITGGDAQTLQTYLGEGWSLRPCLVLEGLLLVAQAA
jgi:type III pantothenate kinase